MKKITSKIAAVLAACVCSVPMFSTISANASVEQFNTYRVYYDAAESGIREFEIELIYDTNIRVQSSKLTDLCPEGIFVNTGNPDKGIQLTYYKAEEGTITETGTMATEKMFVPVDSEINDNFYRYVSFDRSYAADAYGKKMAPAALKIKAFLVGDANGDGKIELPDAILIMQHVGNPTGYPLDEEAKRRADVDGDGVITQNDADLIQKFNIHLISHF